MIIDAQYRFIKQIDEQPTATLANNAQRPETQYAMHLAEPTRSGNERATPRSKENKHRVPGEFARQPIKADECVSMLDTLVSAASGGTTVTKQSDNQVAKTTQTTNRSKKNTEARMPRVTANKALNEKLFKSTYKNASEQLRTPRNGILWQLSDKENASMINNDEDKNNTVQSAVTIPIIATMYTDSSASSFDKLLRYISTLDENESSSLVSYPENKTACTGSAGDLIPSVSSRASLLIEKNGLYGLPLNTTEISETFPERVLIAGLDADGRVLACALQLFDSGIEPIILAPFVFSSGGDDHRQGGLACLARCIGEERVIDDTGECIRLVSPLGFI